MDLVASFLIICLELQLVLVVALNLVLVAVEMVIRVVEIVSSLRFVKSLDRVWNFLETSA